MGRFGAVAALGLGRSFLPPGDPGDMIIPIITVAAREVIETTPPTDKEGALRSGDALEMITAAVLPHSAAGWWAR